MYTDGDFSKANKALKRFVAVFFALTALLLAAFVYSLIERVEWIVYVSAALIAAFSLFLWGNFGIRLVCWRRFLKDMRLGLERETSGVISSIEENEALKEGLEFRAMRLITGDETDKAGGRLLYVESSRFPLPAGPGQKVSCRLFGNYVKDMKVLEEQ